MKPKKTIISILLLVAILPATVYAQASLYKLPKGERSMGIRYGIPDTFDFDKHEIWGYIERGFTDKLKGGALLDITFGNSTLGYYYEDSSYTLFSGMSHLIYIDAIGSTFLDYYIMGAAGGTYGDSDEYFPLRHGYEYHSDQYYFEDSDAGLKSVNFITAGGLIANLGPIKLFVGYVFAHSRVFSPVSFAYQLPSWWNYELVEEPNTRGVSTEGLSFGVELDISQRIRLFVRSYTRVYNRKSLAGAPTLGVGIDFH